jgi:hypothetical protein
MLRICLLLLALFTTSASATLSSPDFMGMLREASALAPTRLPPEPDTRIVTGHFDNKHRTDAVVLSEAGTAFCKGPDFKKCVPITQLQPKKSVPVTNSNGKAVFLQMDSATLGQVCTLDFQGMRAAVDCRSLDFSKLADYGVTKQSQGDLTVMVINGTDGLYSCVLTGATASCQQAKKADGTLSERLLPRRHRKPGYQNRFTPPDQPGTVCTFKHDGFDCRDMIKLGFGTEGLLKPAALFQYDDFDSFNLELQMWTDYMYGEVYGSCTWGACLETSWWEQPQRQPPPPTPRERCLTDCASIHSSMDNICTVSIAIAYGAFGPAVAAAQGIVCYGVRAGVNQVCTTRC